MERKEELKKFVYEDQGTVKVLRGYVLREEDFTFVVQAIGTGEVITIGKRALVKVSTAQGGPQ